MRVYFFFNQTPRTVVKETPMQTYSKCEFCHQFLQTAASPKEGHYYNSSQWSSYPAIVQFIRGGMHGMPCCPG